MLLQALLTYIKDSVRHYKEVLSIFIIENFNYPWRTSLPSTGLVLMRHDELPLKQLMPREKSSIEIHRLQFNYYFTIMNLYYKRMAG